MENSGIEWTHHTFNPWVGCTKVSPACDHCYAEAWAKRSGHPLLWMGKRRRTSRDNWSKVRRWDRLAREAGRVDRVFCASLADVFDNEVPDHWRVELWQLIRETPNLAWLMLTKRVGNVPRMLPPDWGDGWENVWLGITVVNQEETDRDWPKLARIPARYRFLSMEPLLGPVDLEQACDLTDEGANATHIPDWIIVGGESGGEARPMAPAWADAIYGFCGDYGVAFFFKQWGEWLPLELAAGCRTTLETPTRKGIEGTAFMMRVGKKQAGRHYLERTHDEFPDGRKGV